jgi:hypothetical protein
MFSSRGHYLLNSLHLIGGSGCQGCAAPSAARPGLDAGASGDYLAWTSQGVFVDCVPKVPRLKCCLKFLYPGSRDPVPVAQDAGLDDRRRQHRDPEEQHCQSPLRAAVPAAAGARVDASPFASPQAQSVPMTLGHSAVRVSRLSCGAEHLGLLRPFASLKVTGPVCQSCMDLFRCQVGCTC